MKHLIFRGLVGLSVLSLGCDESSSTQVHDASGSHSAAETPSASTAPPSHPAAAAGHHNRLPLGEKTVGNLKLVTTMDAPVKAAGGGDGAFDVVITGGKPKAVRFWVGTEDAQGSVKAKADEETPNNWHTHVEVPSPLPPDSKFWVEVEPATGEKFTTPFDLKTQ